MNVNKIARPGYLVAAIAVTPVMSMGAEHRPCTPGQPTEESYTWNFPKEASGILKDVRTDVSKVENQADRLRGFSMNTGIGWQSHASELSSIKAEINDLGAKLCRLEIIRTAVLPWQQQEIDRTAVLARGLANNTEQAIKYLNNNREHLWSPTYRLYADNLYNESGRLSQSIGNMEKLAKLHREERDVQWSWPCQRVPKPTGKLWQGLSCDEYSQAGD